MRTVTFGVANSLDNFIAGADHGLGWLLWGEEVATLTKVFWKTIDTVLMGRKTYEAGLKMGGAPSYPGLKTYVFSRTMQESGDKNLEIIAEDASRFVRKLKESSGKGICMMGGGVLAKSLFEAGLIDEVAMNIHPVILGSGIPLFLPMEKTIELDLLECTPFKNGCIFVRYGVKR